MPKILFGFYFLYYLLVEGMFFFFLHNIFNNEYINAKDNVLVEGEDQKHSYKEEIVKKRVIVSKCNRVAYIFAYQQDNIPIDKYEQSTIEKK